MVVSWRLFMSIQSCEGLVEVFSTPLQNAFKGYKSQNGTTKIIHSLVLQINLIPWIPDVKDLTQYEPCRFHLINPISTHQASLKLIPVCESVIATFNKHQKQVKFIGIEIVSKLNYHEARNKKDKSYQTIQTKVHGLIEFAPKKWIEVSPFPGLQISTKVFTLSEDVFSLKVALAPHLEKLFMDIVTTLSETMHIPSFALSIEPENGSSTHKEKIFLLTPLIENTVMEQLFRRFSQFTANCKEPFKWVTYKIEIIATKVPLSEDIPPMDNILPGAFQGQLIPAPGGLWFDKTTITWLPPAKKCKVDEEPYPDLPELPPLFDLSGILNTQG